MNKSHLLSLAITATLGLVGTGLILFAWELPPFSASQPTTENAYVRGQVTSLSPQISGYVAEVLISDFQQVKGGEVLFRLDRSSLTQKLHQSEAALASAKASRAAAVNTLHASELATQADMASLEAARLSEKKAKSDNDRQHSLEERGIRSSAATEQADLALSQARAQLASLEASLAAQQEKLAALRSQIEAADAAVAQAEASVALAKIDLEHAEVKAPSDGRLGQIGARVGQYVTAATALASHIGSERWVIANFTETSYDRLSIGQPVSIKVDALGGRVVAGHIASFSPATGSEFSLVAGSNATGNFTKVVQRIPTRIELDEGQELLGALLPGMSVVVTAEKVDLR